MRHDHISGDVLWNHVSMSYRLRDPSFLVNVAWAIFEKQFFFLDLKVIQKQSRLDHLG